MVPGLWRSKSCPTSSWPTGSASRFDRIPSSAAMAPREDKFSLTKHRSVSHAFVECEALSGFPYRSNPSQGYCFVLQRMVKIPAKLQIHPEGGSVPEEFGQSQSGTRRNAALSIYELVHPLVGHTDAIRELALTGASSRFGIASIEHVLGSRRGEDPITKP